MSIKSQLDKITKKIDLRMGRAAQEIMEETKHKLKECIDDLWYKPHSPKDYQRSYDLINSVSGRIVKNGIGNYAVEVYFDPALMTSNPGLHSWGTHASFDGSDFRAGLISSIIHGVGGADSNPRKGENTNVIEVVQEQANEYANGILKKYI